MEKLKKEWFGEWFDSPYYHVLYKNRDKNEASVFINNLISHFKIETDHKVLDLACGKGRHSIFLNKKGFDVVGVDLSEQSINYARQYENDKLHFFIHDMRKVFVEEEFDFILNLFTSFGYFETDQEHEQAICAVAKALKPGGVFLIDFLNSYKIKRDFVPVLNKEVDGIHFHITKELTSDGYIKKNIAFEDNGQEHNFYERVKLVTQQEFESYFKKANLQTIAIFGDYDLRPYDPETSDRMIFIARNS